MQTGAIRNLTISAAGGVGCAIALVLTSGAVAVDTDNLVPYGPPGAIEPAAIRQTDNADVYFYMDSNGDFELESGDKQNVNNMIDSQYRETDLAFGYDSNPTFSGTAETDHIWQEGTVSGSAEGRAWCDDRVGQYACDQHYIRIESGNFSQGLSCHEMGHAVGLTHGEDASPSVSNTNDGLGCMQTPVNSGENLGRHNKRMINGSYSQ